MKARNAQRKKGKKSRGKDPKLPSDNPPDKTQFNFTYSESRIMKSGNSKHFEQAYNAQVAEGSMLVLVDYM